MCLYDIVIWENWCETQEMIRFKEAALNSLTVCDLSEENQQIFNIRGTSDNVRDTKMNYG